jgi:hypothetical protein
VIAHSIRGNFGVHTQTLGDFFAIPTHCIPAYDDFSASHVDFGVLRRSAISVDGI